MCEQRRNKVEIKHSDFTRTDSIQLDDEREESSDDFEAPRRRVKRNRTTEGASTSAAAARKRNLTLIGNGPSAYCFQWSQVSVELFLYVKTGVLENRN